MIIIYYIIMKRTEQKYLDDNGLTEAPKCYCGNTLKFRSYKLGYAHYCSAKCANSDPIKKERTRQNNIVKYGVENISQLQSVKKKKEGKCNKGHGKPWTEETRLAIRQTMRSRYGVDHPSQLPDYLEKRKQTWVKKYGVEHISTLETTRTSKRIKKDKITALNHPDILNIEHKDGETIYTVNCDIHGNFEIPCGIYYDRKRLGSCLCTKCQPIGFINRSKLELFVETILKNNNISFEKHKRGIIGSKELDFYIPSHRIAIECNGVYWHSDVIKTDKKYHANKYQKCLEQGIQLLQLWEDWIINKPDIVEDLILSKLGIYGEKIGARKCIVREITQTQVDSILQHHIQGTLNASHKLGLFYKNELIACMLFNKVRGSMMGKTYDGYELSRFCSIPGHQIIGGAGKLLTYFIKNTNPTKIISFSANDISMGNVYKALGFMNTKISSGSYWYIANNSLTRFHRFHFRKSELRKMGYMEGTEFEIMNKLPYHRIYDSGTTCWELDINKKEVQ